MNRNPLATRDVTVEDLQEFMISYLETRGDNAQQIAAYLEAQKLSGWLRPSCPAWIRNSAAVWYLLPPSKNLKRQNPS